MQGYEHDIMDKFRIGKILISMVGNLGQIINEMFLTIQYRKYDDDLRELPILHTLLNKISANLYIFNKILREINTEDYFRLKTPSSLIFRGILSDCINATYIIAISQNKVALQDELLIMDLDYIKFLKDNEEYNNECKFEDDSKMQSDTNSNWILEFKKNNPEFFEDLTSIDFNLKQPKKIRRTPSMNKNGRLTEKEKYLHLKSIPEYHESKFLYFIYRRLSQHQHFAPCNLKLIHEDQIDDYHNYFVGLTSIAETIDLIADKFSVVSNTIQEKRTIFHNLVQEYQEEVIKPST